MSLVSFVKIQRNTIDSMRQAILESLDLIEYSFEKDVRNVVIKPNLCYYWDYSTGQTVDPRYVGALIELIREEISPDTSISIVESDASAMKCKYAFRMLGYTKLAQEYNVELVNLTEDKCDRVEVTTSGQSFHFMIPLTIQNADLRINIPKIKYTLEKIKMTCALKNIFGCNPYQKKFRYHSKLEEVIVALNKVMRFDLCLIDGNIVSGIQPRRLGLTMASRDPVAIDVAAGQIAGLNPRKIRYIQLACEEGLGRTSFVSKGASLDYFKSRYPRKTIRAKLMSNAYNMVVHMGMGNRFES